MKRQAVEQERMPLRETVEREDHKAELASDAAPAGLLKQEELLVARYTHWLRYVLWCEAVLGVSILLCVATMASLAMPPP